MPSQRRTAVLRRTLIALALPLLLGAATPPPVSRPGARAVAQREATARRALTAVTDHYRALKGYELEGRGGTMVTSSQGNSESVTWVRFKVRRPDRYNGEI